MLHTAAGLTIASDRPLPGFVPTRQASCPPDIVVHTFPPERWRPAEDPTALLSPSGDGYAWRYDDGTRFWMDPHGREIWCSWQTTLEDACTYLAGPVIALALRARGELALHASAVIVDGRALALAGPHGAGKSTAAAALGRRGFAVLSDDLLRVTERDAAFVAHPFTSMLRLWPEGEQEVLGSAGSLARITPTWNKLALAPGAHGVEWSADAAPVGWVVCLSGPAGDAPSSDVRTLTPGEALIRMAANSSGAQAISKEMRAREFRQLAVFVERVRHGAVEAPAAGRSLDGFVDRLLRWTSGARASE